MISIIYVGFISTFSLTACFVFTAHRQKLVIISFLTCIYSVLTFEKNCQLCSLLISAIINVTVVYFLCYAIIIRFVVVLVYKNCIRAGSHIAQFAQSFFRIIPIHNTVIDYVQCFGFSRNYFIYSIIN